MRINEDSFMQLYKGKVQDADYTWHLLNSTPKDSEDFRLHYLPSKLWRLNNLYYIIDKKSNKVKFDMNYAQHYVYSALLDHARLLILKSRQRGISTFWLVDYFDDTITLSNIEVGMQAQGEDESKKLLEKVKILWNSLNGDVKTILGSQIEVNNKKEFSLANGSKIFVRMSFRSTTLARLHVSELGKIANSNPERAKEIKTGTLQALAPGNPGVIESTAEGDNMFKEEWDKAVDTVASRGKPGPKDFAPVFLPWDTDPDCEQEEHEEHTDISRKYFKELSLKGINLSQRKINFWISQYRELGDTIYQEYPRTPEEAFRALRKGTYYADLYQLHILTKGRIKDGLYDPRLLVHTAWDLGVDDYMFITYFQMFDGHVRLIGEECGSGMSLEYYVKLTKARGWSYGSWLLPHDIAVREMGTGRDHARSRKAILEDLCRKHGIQCTLDVGTKNSIEVGIEQVRKLLKHLWIDSSCPLLRAGFLNYSKKLDKKTGLYLGIPDHNEFSHSMDSIRTLVMGDVGGRSVRLRNTAGYSV